MCRQDACIDTTSLELTQVGLGVLCGSTHLKSWESRHSWGNVSNRWSVAWRLWVGLQKRWPQTTVIMRCILQSHAQGGYLRAPIGTAMSIWRVLEHSSQESSTGDWAPSLHQAHKVISFCLIKKLSLFSAFCRR
jgi:hypothetical protein